ncbi:MAG: 3-isopropylmalate dehydratase small subunit [Synergistetes bacterium]|nr:3-isopropylmalate dehydratase small subunit [Synergistota bacterium]
MIIEGVAFLFGDNIDTDQIYPGRYLDISEHGEMAEHAMEGADPDFYRKVSGLAGERPIIVAGKNFGCGSSREHAVIALKEAGVQAVVARSFARIFYRNALNQGLLPIEVPGLDLEKIRDGAKVKIDLKGGILEIGELTFDFKPFSEKLLKILLEGGIISYIKKGGSFELFS